MFCIVCENTQGLLLPQLLDRHVLLAVFLHHLVKRTGDSLSKNMRWGISFILLGTGGCEVNQIFIFLRQCK